MTAKKTKYSGGKDAVRIDQTMAFIGAGNMAEALVGSLVSGGLVPAGRIIAADIRRERLSYLKKKFKVNGVPDAGQAVTQAAVIVLSVKPQQVEALLKDIGSGLTSSQLVISIAAGITTGFIEGLLPRGISVIRAMPNTPALLGAGATALSRGKHAGSREIAIARRIFSACGIVVELPERSIDAVTALSGSGPAYVFYMAEILEKAGMNMGLPRAVASQLARQTIYGAGRMLAELPETAGELRRRVTSPGGTTEAAVRFLEGNSFMEILEQAVIRARKRARELAK